MTRDAEAQKARISLRVSIVAAVIALGMTTHAIAQGETPSGGLRLPPATPGAGAPESSAQPFRALPPPSPARPDPSQEERRDLGVFVDINKRTGSAPPAAGSAPAADDVPPADGFNFPGLIRAIGENRYDDVPDDRDTRSVVFSILKAFSESCGPPPPDVTIAATSYGSDLVRKTNKDPAAGAMILLQDLANMAGKPPAEGISGFIRKNGLVSPDGEDDGRLFVSRNGCGSDGYRAFATRLGSLIMRRSEREPAPLDEPIFAMLASPEFRARNNIPDPTAELARRKSAALKKSAQASCEKSFDRPGFCACAMKGLDAAGIGDANWQTLGRSFHSIGTLGAQRADLMNAVRGCYRPPG